MHRFYLGQNNGSSFGEMMSMSKDPVKMSISLSYFDIACHARFSTLSPPTKLGTELTSMVDCLSCVATF
jgi:hypothetical protein